MADDWYTRLVDPEFDGTLVGCLRQLLAVVLNIGLLLTGIFGIMAFVYCVGWAVGKILMLIL